MQLNYHREGTGEPLVLIHGIGLTWQSWLPVIDLLARSSLWITSRISRLIAPRAESLLRSPTRRKLLGSQASRHPERAEPEEMAATVRAFAYAPWFDETLRAINRQGFTGGAQISVPVTVAWGQYDRLLLPHQARRAGRMIPLARVVTLSDCGHVPMGDDPEQVARVLLEGSGG